MNNRGLGQLEEIFEETFGDGQGDPADGQEGSEEEVPQVDAEQSDVDEQVPAKLSDLVFDSEEQAEDDSASADIFEQVVSLPDGEQLPVRELVDGYLRRKDYTQKTQEVAQLRKEAENALELYELFKKDPRGTVASLAIEMGLLDAGEVDLSPTASPALEKLGVKEPTFDESKIEEIVAKRVEEELAKRLEEDPAIKEARVQEARNRVNRIFDSIEQTYGDKLDSDDRNAILKAALSMETDNLEYVYLKLKAQLEAKKRASQNVKNAAPKKSQSSGVSSDDDLLAEPPKDIFEAWRQAEFELSR